MNGTASKKKRELSKRGKQSSRELIPPTVPTRETAPTSVSRQAGGRAINAVWTYEPPNDVVAAIRNCLAFYPESVDAIEERPQ
jgi:hypothetical protein